MQPPKSTRGNAAQRCLVCKLTTLFHSEATDPKGKRHKTFWQTQQLAKLQRITKLSAMRYLYICSDEHHALAAKLRSTRDLNFKAEFQDKLIAITGTQSALEAAEENLQRILTTDPDNIPARSAARYEVERLRIIFRQRKRRLRELQSGAKTMNPTDLLELARSALAPYNKDASASHLTSPASNSNI